MDKFLNSPIMSKIIEILSSVFQFETNPTRFNLIVLFFSISFSNHFRSINSIFENCIKYVTQKTPSSIYSMFSKSEYIFYDDWYNKILKDTLSLLKKSDKDDPLFVTFDDTNIHKVGTKFERLSRLWDHCAGEYFSGFNSVCVSLSVFIKEKKNERKIITVPVNQKLWHPKDKNNNKNQDSYETRFELLVPVLENIIETVGSDRKIILLCDSWYSRGDIKEIVQKYSNVEMIAAVRKDTVLYELPPAITERKRGAPRKKGDRIDLEKLNFVKIKNEKFQIAHTKCVTNLFGLDKVVDIIATKSESGSIRLFISTVDYIINEEILFTSDENKKKAKKYLSVDPNFLPLLVYQYRWNIEVYFNMVKEYWGYESFKVRKYTSITRVLNFITTSFSITVLLPYLCDELSFLKGKSPQHTRDFIGKMFYGTHLIQDCAVRAQRPEIIPDLLKSYQNLAFQMGLAC